MGRIEPGRIVERDTRRRSATSVALDECRWTARRRLRVDGLLRPQGDRRGLRLGGRIEPATATHEAG